MRDIAHSFFAQSPALAGPLLALLLFFVVFVLIVRRVLRSRAADWTSDAALALEGDGPAPAQRTEPNVGERS